MKRDLAPVIALPSRQGGVVLVVGLIMVLLMTIVGLAAIRGSGLQETMAGNMRDRNLAFQAAEAGLREGEAFLDDNWIALAFNGTEAGLYQDLNQPGRTPMQNWVGSDWAGANSIATDLELYGIAPANRPRYVVEKLDVVLTPGADGGAVDFVSQLEVFEVEYFRITSRGLGGSPNAEAVVQSTFKP